MPRLHLWWILSLGWMLSLDGTAASVHVVLQNYRGWWNSLVLGNGRDGDSMVWVGSTEVVRIDLPRKSDATYPDGGCCVEIYTNPDPVPYVELETLDPLPRRRAGESLRAINRDRLEPRQETDPGQEARRILAP